jgi:hypothetical protein
MPLVMLDAFNDVIPNPLPDIIVFVNVHPLLNTTLPSPILLDTPVPPRDTLKIPLVTLLASIPVIFVPTILAVRTMLLYCEKIILRRFP